MYKIIIILIFMLIIGLLLVYVYNLLFKRNISKVLNNEQGLKLPDLNDLVITYMILCILILFSIALKTTAIEFDKKVSTCDISDVKVEEIPHDFGFCVNYHGNLIFKDQNKAIDDILVHYGELQNKLEKEYRTISTDKFDNFYYSLQNDLDDDEKKELYILYSIYRNYYHTDHLEEQNQKGW